MIGELSNNFGGKDHWKKHLATAILFLITLIFSVKYLGRYSEYGTLMACSLFVFQVAGYIILKKIKPQQKIVSTIAYTFIAVLLAVIILTQIYIPLESLNVDRWSVISSFIIELQHGNYPYFATSHLGNPPGPMPVYFLISAPFYYLSSLSVLSGLGYIIMIGLIARKKNHSHDSLFLLLYIFTCLYVYWEVVARSNVFSFSMLVVLLLVKFNRERELEKYRLYGLAILTGLLLSTRSIYILPYLVFFLSSLLTGRIKINKMLVFGGIAFTSFVTSFLPLVISFGGDFFEMNPFIIQSSFLIPQFYTIIFVGIAIVLTFFVRNRSDNWFYSGLSLFIAIMIYTIYHIYKEGLNEAYFESTIDISYFIFCVPFLLMYILETSKKHIVT